VSGVCVVPAVSAAVAAGVVVFVVELIAFFFALGAVAVCVEAAVCAEAIDPTIRNAPTQKLAANFRYLFIDPSCHPFSTPSPTNPGRYNFRSNQPPQLRTLTCCDTNEVFQSASADLNFMQSG
jgi:hypothetical protein